MPLETPDALNGLPILTSLYLTEPCERTVARSLRERWLSWPWRPWNRWKVIIKFVGDDWSRDLHDHPKRFISIGLRGGYIEQSRQTVLGVPFDLEREYRAPWIRTFPWTLVIATYVPKE